MIRPFFKIRPIDDSPGLQSDIRPIDDSRTVRVMTSQMKKSPTSPADNVVALYQEHARAFERQRSRDLFERGWLTRFLALLPASGKPRVLDIGCGNGVPIARHLIEQGCEITGVDTSLPLLAGAQAAFPDHRWIAADMRRMPLNETFHGLIAWHSFFHLRPEDQRPMFATFARLAAPGAPLMFTSGTTLGKRSGNSKDSRCITAAWTARSIAICWKPTVSKWCDMSSGTRNAVRANVWLARRGGAVEGETRQPRITAVPGEISRG
ncbi:class I SAM-dependent methyltransferase [Achromobacter xylosoxidans]